jgi:hypothetical protein
VYMYPLALVGGVLQMVSKLTLTVRVRVNVSTYAHGACGPEMGHMAWHMGRHRMYGCALRGNIPGHFAGVSVRTYTCACGPRIGCAILCMVRHRTGELDRRGRRVL